jgi:catechol 2,3-dioxygenase-like lactoylglutathione lyase family enzyme
MPSRVQLALNVSDLEAAIAFYRRLFAVEPAARRPGSAVFDVIDPPVRLVLSVAADERGDDACCAPGCC